MSGNQGHSTYSSQGFSNEKIEIEIYNGVNGTIATYRVPVNLPVQKLLKKYCEHQNMEYSAMKFYYNRRRLQVRRTVAELHMVDGDSIGAIRR